MAGKRALNFVAGKRAVNFPPLFVVALRSPNQVPYHLTAWGVGLAGGAEGIRVVWSKGSPL